MSAAPSFPNLIDPGPRKRFTRTEVESLLSTGAFQGERFELIDGDLIDKMGQNPPHAYAIRLVFKWLRTIFDGDRAQMQLPVEMTGGDRERSVPEPDVAVLAELKDEYQKRHPRGDELVLAVEIADSSAAFDLSRKAALYAAARIPEYWVVDLTRRQLVVHRHPDGTQYRSTLVYAENEIVSLEGRSETTLVRAFLPSPE